MSKTERPTRDRIVLAAGKLFHKEGIRAVSMDAVAELTGVTKRTLYYHFRSKDDLIAAHLEARDQPNLALFQQWFDEAEGDIADRIKGIFDKLAQSARHPKWKGCGFLRTSVELINLPGHPAVVAGRRHKKRVEDWFCSILDQPGDPDRVRRTARQIILLLDGAFSVVLLHRDASYMESAGEAAAFLVRSMGGASKEDFPDPLP
ncbi:MULTISPECIES: TetR/AcrR family transcriptional regulator [unclassified Rhizobium]|uniref:TetR/AcrR family transcriptional regulator n=1 Tax=unclassified Rhizobium TaxID=2613769 RepID=UPI0006F2EE4D|nr:MULTISPECIES: TetR/AcrR family transcriptional regulator [unclassified Rhizobium]KQV35171.1 TetR family transcriptional regulator [Rhizobium sp. Root1212]KRD24976.1 TetR family transcriptional regulator [Rhizobium sp. Root268]